MKKAAIISWCLLILYLSVNLFVGAHPVLKELPEGINKNENIQIIKEWQKSPLTKIQEIMIPVWRYNRYIYGSLLVFCLLFTFLARTKKTDNQSFKPTPKSGAV